MSVAMIDLGKGRLPGRAQKGWWMHWKSLLGVHFFTLVIFFGFSRLDIPIELPNNIIRSCCSSIWTTSIIFHSCFSCLFLLVYNIMYKISRNFPLIAMLAGCFWKTYSIKQQLRWVACWTHICATWVWHARITIFT